MEEVRCGSSILFGMLDTDTMIIEIKCRSNRCGATRGVVVIHRFSCKTGELLSTNRFKDPAIRSEKRGSTP